MAEIEKLDVKALNAGAYALDAFDLDFDGCEGAIAAAVIRAYLAALRPVTEEAVEAAARAMYLQFTGTDPDWKYRVDKNGYRQAPYVDEVPAWKWHWEAHARAALRAALSAGTVPGVVEGWQPTHRHKKRGSTYQYLGTGTLQTAEMIGDDVAVAIYQGEDGRLWARPSLEFADGRFEVLDPTPAGKRIRSALTGGEQ